MIDLNNILLATFAVLALYYIFHLAKLKEFANKVAARHCADVEVQFLDQTVFLQKFRITRGASGRLGIERHYHFEFTTTGEDRYTGQVILFGYQVVSVFLAPHKIQ